MRGLGSAITFIAMVRTDSASCVAAVSGTQDAVIANWGNQATSVLRVPLLRECQWWRELIQVRDDEVLDTEAA